MSEKAEDAYRERDAAALESRDESFAAGEAHAYGDASDEIRDAQEQVDDK